MTVEVASTGTSVSRIPTLVEVTSINQGQIQRNGGNMGSGADNMDKMETWQAIQEMAEDFATADHEIRLTSDAVNVAHDVKINWEQAASVIDSPPHYQGTYGIECIEAIRNAMSDAEFRGYCKGNAIKYIWREGDKGGDESLRKAIQNLKFALGEA